MAASDNGLAQSLNFIYNCITSINQIWARYDKRLLNLSV